MSFVFKGVNLGNKKIEKVDDFSFHSWVSDILIVFPLFNELNLLYKPFLIDFIKANINTIVFINRLSLDKIQTNEQFLYVLFFHLFFIVNPVV